MRVIFVPLLAASTIATADTGVDVSGQPSGQQAESLVEVVPPEHEAEPVSRESPVLNPVTAQNCRDTISQARQEAGKPPLLDREPASPDKPYHIYAVDRRQDGCAVMVMKGDPSDIRPLPVAPDGPLMLMPLGSGR